MTNLTKDIQELLLEAADTYIYSFIYPRIPDERYKAQVKKVFMECFEEGTPESKAYTAHEVDYKLMGWKLNRKHFLNEYWVETQYVGITKIWAKNKTSVRKTLATSGYGKIGRILLVKYFDKKAFINSLTS